MEGIETINLPMFCRWTNTQIQHHRRSLWIDSHHIKRNMSSCSQMREAKEGWAENLCCQDEPGPGCRQWKWRRQLPPVQHLAMSTAPTEAVLNASRSNPRQYRSFSQLLWLPARPLSSPEWLEGSVIQSHLILPTFWCGLQPLGKSPWHQVQFHQLSCPNTSLEAGLDRNPYFHHLFILL